MIETSGQSTLLFLVVEKIPTLCGNEKEKKKKKKKKNENGGLVHKDL